MGDESARAKEGRPGVGAAARSARSRRGPDGAAPYVALAVLVLIAWAVAVVWALRARSERSPAVGPAGARIDLNEAEPEELQTLSGVGPVLSRRIVEERDRAGGFGSVDDLLRVQGVTTELVERLRPFLHVGGEVSEESSGESGGAGPPGGTGN
jgi:competence protein ComEA